MGSRRGPIVFSRGSRAWYEDGAQVRVALDVGQEARKALRGIAHGRHYRTMAQALALLTLLALSGCAGLLPRTYQPAPSPCALSEASYECQVERYQNVNVD